MTNEQIAFVNAITPLVKNYALSYGHNPRNIAAIVAQAVNESSWGKSKLASQYFNYWGMKCGSSWTGPAVNMNTKEEYAPGTLTNVSAYFRVYSDMDTGVKGYFDFINTSRYSNLKNTSCPREYLETIKADGYATSSTYVSNIMKIVNQISYLINGSTPPVTDTSDLNKIALEVIAGRWGNGNARKTALENAGYNYKEVQTRVNALLIASKSKKRR